MNTDTISPIELPPPTQPDYRHFCFRCGRKPRAMVFLPDDMGSFLGAECKECSRISEVVARLNKQEQTP